MCLRCDTARYGLGAAAMVAALWLSGCWQQGQAPATASAAAMNTAGFQAETRNWREQRRQALLRPDGWTSLVGLFWLQPGRYRVGAAADSELRLERGPARIGVVTVAAGTVWFDPADDGAVHVGGRPLREPLRLRSDQASDGATIVEFDHGKGRLSLIQRGERRALRLRHADAPARVNFAGLSYWPVDPAWRIEGRYRPNPPGTTLPIVDIIGTSSAQPNPGAIEFDKGGRRYRLQAIAGSGEALFVVFADRSNGHGSYPAGRFIDVAAADADGRVVIDFNRAYNPPCAFTPFATCPLPPPQNRLDLAVSAGEQRYHALP